MVVLLIVLALVVILFLALVITQEWLERLNSWWADFWDLTIGGAALILVIIIYITIFQQG